MRRHIAYMKYVLRHKWFVLVASKKIGTSLRLALLHDLSKFRLSEWMPYAATFYEKDGSKRYVENDAFSSAWNDHQKRNRHHWQYFLITWDHGGIEPLPMPHRFVFEMVADWMGAGRAITGRWEVAEWYENNKSKIQLHDDTRKQVEKIINTI